MDFEELMADIGEIVKTNFQTLVTKINTEKGDSLLETFDPNKFELYAIENYNFNIHYCQGVLDIVKVNSTEQGTALTYEIGLDVIIARQAKGLSNQAKRMERYTRLLVELVNSYIAQKYDARIETVSGTTFKDIKQGQLYDYARVSFLVDVIY